MPYLDLDSILDGDQLGYIRQNQNNLLLAFALDPRVVANNIATPAGTVLRGDAWILSGAGGGQWTGQTAGTVAMALSDDPVSSAGWLFIAPYHGLRAWVLAGSPTGHLVYNGSSWVAV